MQLYLILICNDPRLGNVKYKQGTTSGVELLLLINFMVVYFRLFQNEFPLNNIYSYKNHLRQSSTPRSFFLKLKARSNV